MLGIIIFSENYVVRLNIYGSAGNNLLRTPVVISSLLYSLV